MRKPLVAGNWKMNGLQAQVMQLTTDILAHTNTLTHIDMVLLPSFLHVPLVQSLLQNSTCQLGAQNLYLGESGAVTGEVSGAMLADAGCQYVLIGHSERRTLFHEDLPLIAAKFSAALQCGLIPILCVGETQQQRQAGQTESIIREQVVSVIDALPPQALRQTVIAYEPVWAIGTGLTATPEQAEDVHQLIREIIAQKHIDLAKAMRILYGGSMKPDNAAALLAQPNIDGGLIGGASLNAASFIAICQQARTM